MGPAGGPAFIPWKPSDGGHRAEAAERRVVVACPSMATTLEALLRAGPAKFNELRKRGEVASEQTGATLRAIVAANVDLANMSLVGSEFEGCELSRATFKDTDLSNAYLHGGRLTGCDFRGATLEGASFERMKIRECDFTGAVGLGSVELERCDIEDCVGWDPSDSDDDDDDE